MQKDMAELPPDIQAQVRALEALPDDQIDTTDAPELLDWSDATEPREISSKQPGWSVAQ